MTLHDYFQDSFYEHISEAQVWQIQEGFPGTYDLIVGCRVRAGDKTFVVYEKDDEWHVDPKPDFWHGTARDAIDAYFVWLRSELQSRYVDVTRYDRPETPLRLPSFR